MTRVFISYSHDSPQHADRVLGLADRLIEQGVECIIDHYEEAPAEGWPLWMERHTETADYILVVCTETYTRRAKREEPPGVGRGVKWESVLIYQDLYDADSLNTKFVPVLFDSADEQHIPRPLRGVTHYRVDTDDGYKKLYRRLTKQPARVKPTPGQVVAMPPENLKQSPASVWNVPFERNVFFTGRGKELEELRQALAQNSEAALSQQAIYGLGGIGKTQMAVEYAYRHKDEYRAVLWVRADSEQSIITGYAESARLLDLPEKDAEKIDEVVFAVKRWLEREEGWLLIFDNADKPTLLKPYKPIGGEGHILITSRARSFGILGIKKSIELKKMLPEEATDFLLARTGRDKASRDEIDAAARLARAVDYLPLALEQAGAYIAEKQVRIQDYLTSYENRRLELLNKKGPEAGDYPKSVATTWELNFKEVEEESRAAIELMKLSAFLSPDSIPFELVTGGRSELGEEISLALTGVEEDPLRLGELLSPLIRYSLIRVDEESQSYSIHRLVQEVVKDGIDEEAKLENVERIVEAVSRVFPTGRYGTWAECERLLEQGKAAVKLIEEKESIEEGQLLDAMGIYYYERGQYGEAEPLLSKAKIVYEKELGEEHPEVATSLNNLAALYHSQGRYKEAELLYHRALSIREQALGEDHPDLAQSLNDLGALYYSQGRYEEAERLYDRALKIWEKELGEEHPEVATSLNNLASLYCDQGRYEEAELLYNRALGIREKVLGEEHPDLAQSLCNLALFYINQDRYAEAEPLFKRALKIWEKELGEEHPEVAQGLNNLAGLYYEQGRYAEAEPLLNRALKIREKVLGEEHPDLAQSLNNLAGLYKNQGRYGEAELLYNRALGIREKVLGKDHPDVATTLNSLGVLYDNQGRYEEAEPLYNRALRIREWVLGRDHPNVALSLNNLAVLYKNQGRYEEAEPLMNQALKILEKSLGESHSYFLFAFKNYAVLLRKLNRNAEAEEIEGRAQAIQERIAQRNTQA